MNIFRTYFLFHKSLRRFDRLSCNLTTLSKQLNHLNENRKITQRKIIELSKDNKECTTCQGLCCQGDYNHFTAIDYLIRLFSDNPLEGYGVLWTPKSIAAILLSKIKALLDRSSSTERTSNTKCSYLDFNGCYLKPEDRPIRCVLWTCRGFRQSLPPHTLMEIGILTKELSSISCQVLKSFRKA